MTENVLQLARIMSPGVSNTGMGKNALQCNRLMSLMTDDAIAQKVQLQLLYAQFFFWQPNFELFLGTFCSQFSPPCLVIFIVGLLKANLPEAPLKVHKHEII